MHCTLSSFKTSQQIPSLQTYKLRKYVLGCIYERYREGEKVVINKTERIVLENEVRDLYEAYQHRKSQIERIIREKIEREIAAEQGDALRDLSKALHEYHRRGLPKSALRVATKKYGNNSEFLKLWNAYEPEDAFALAVGRQTTPVFEWRDKVLYVHKNPVTQEVLAETIAVPMYSLKSWFMGVSDTVENALNELVGGYQMGRKVARAVDEEIQRAAEAREITESTDPFDYVNELPDEDRAGYLENEYEKNHSYNPWIKKEN